MARVDKFSKSDRQRIYKNEVDQLKERKRKLQASKESGAEEYKVLKNRRKETLDKALGSQKTFNTIFDGINTAAKVIGTVVGGPALGGAVNVLNDAIKKGLGPNEVDEDREAEIVQDADKQHQSYLDGMDKALLDTDNEIQSIVNRNPDLSWE